MKYRMILGIDYGRSKIGIALGEKIALSRGFLPNDSEIIDKIANIIRDDQVDLVVIGWPVRDSGASGTLSAEIKRFAAKIKAECNVNIKFITENSTTFEANEKLKSANINIKSSKQQVDGLAAAVILQQYLDQVASR